MLRWVKFNDGRSGEFRKSVGFRAKFFEILQKMYAILRNFWAFCGRTSDARFSIPDSRRKDVLNADFADDTERIKELVN